MHVFITFPKIRHPCHHVIDFHTEEELFAHHYTTAQTMKKALGLKKYESLVFAQPQDLEAVIGTKHLCNECYRK